MTVLYPRRGVSEMTRFTPEEVETKYGLTPAQYPDFAALRGDPSDNLPNIPSVGEKTAAKWVREYGSLTALAEQVDTVKGKAGDALREHLASVLRNRKLTELVTDVEVGVTVDELARQQWDREQVHELFDDLQFRVLRERLFQSVAAAAPEAEEGFDVAFVRLDLDDVTQWLDEHARDGAPGRRGFPGPVGTRYRHADRRRPGRARRCGGLRRPVPASARTTTPHWPGGWPTQSIPKAAHDVKGPALALRQHGWTIAGITSDTQLAAYLLRPDQRTFDLADLALRYLRRELRSNDSDLIESGQLTLDGGLDESDDALAEIETLRATAVIDLADAFGAELEKDGATRLLTELELPLTFVLADMEAVGIAADTDGCSTCSPSWPGRSSRSSRMPISWSDVSSTSARPSSCKRSCSTSSSCPRRSGSRPATRPTPIRWPTCTSRPNTRCSSCCCDTARSPGSSPSWTGCCR